MPTRVAISFRSALSRFTSQLLSELPPAQQDHLARWADHDQAEKIWEKIQRLAWGPVGSYDPLDGFIAMILAAKFMADSIKASKLLIEIRKERSVLCVERARQLEELAKTWRAIADSNHPKAELALNRANQHEHEAQGWRKLAHKPRPSPPFLISRIDKSGSRNQRAFMQLVGRYIIDLCGRPLDSEVAMLNDVAFATAEPTSVFQARSCRRPTTRKARKAKKARVRKKPKVRKT
jgi:hypothetical protein